MLSVVTRFHDFACRKTLTEAVFSIWCQKYRPVECIIVCQSLSEDQIAETERLLEPYRDDIDVRIVNIQCIGDQRARLLNEGVRVAIGRYLAFLDYDDIVYPLGWQTMIDYLEERTDVAMVIGNITMAEVTYVGKNPFVAKKYPRDHSHTVADLSLGNFAPLHSYVIDLSRAQKEAIAFDEELPVLEDYAFLLSFTSKHKATTALHHTIGEYRLRNGHSVEAARQQPDCTSPSQYDRALAKIERMKERESITLTYAELKAVNALWKGAASAPAAMKPGLNGHRPEPQRGPDRRLFAKAWPRALLHACRETTRRRRRIRRNLELLRGTGGVDREWYLSRYPDVAKSGMDPAEHYLFFGASEGRDPNPEFSTRKYLAEHPEALNSESDPLSHCLSATHRPR